MFTEEFCLNIEDHAKMGEAMVMVAYKKGPSQPIPTMLVVDSPIVIPVVIVESSIITPVKWPWWKVMWFYLNMDVIELAKLMKEKWSKRKVK